MDKNSEPPADSCTCADEADGQTMAWRCPVHGEVWRREQERRPRVPPACPWCGEPLVEDFGKRGVYLACDGDGCDYDYWFTAQPPGGAVDGLPPFLGERSEK